MKNLDHPNVIRLYEIFEDRLFIYLVMGNSIYHYFNKYYYIIVYKIIY